MDLNKLLHFSYSLVPFYNKVLNIKNSLRIIYYHKVNTLNQDYYNQNGMNITVFENQIQYLTNKYKIIPLNEAYQRTLNGENLNGCVCLTFDDGFSDCYNIIYPILKKYKITATFYLIENTIDNVDFMWRNKLTLLDNKISSNQRINLINIFNENYKLNSDSKSSLFEISNNWKMEEKEIFANFLWDNSKIGNLNEYLNLYKPYLVTEQIFEMINQGQEIGSHTKTHPFCNLLSKQEIDFEIINSIKSLKQKFGYNINSLSYPFGNRPSETLEKYIMSESKISILLGIHDNLKNKNNPNKWERTGMEKDYYKSLNSFYLKSFYRKLTNK